MNKTFQSINNQILNNITQNNEYEHYGKRIDVLKRHKR